MSGFRPSFSLLVGLIVLLGLAGKAHAFGAGNIASLSKVEGQNWRHGDIEDALLTLAMAKGIGGKKFNKIMVSRVYFGNWLRDYSQAIDVGTVKSVSAEAIRLLLCILGFLSFGYGSGEFEVTAERLGCYRPEDHIDNPKDYAENQDARKYDRRLRGPVDERRELSIDPRSGMKNYIANEEAGIMTSAAHVRNLFGRCIELGRRYKDRNNKEDLYESLRLMGTGLHCLEDFFAHSNYIELALIELGERDVFPHTGRRTQMQIEGVRNAVYPLVTGTFGGVDFLHSVVGEVSDKMTQNEIQELEGTLKDSQKADTSMLRDLLDKIPDGIIGGSSSKKGDRIDEIQHDAQASQLQNMQVSPREPEEFTQYVQGIFKQIMPVIEFHDEVMQGISAAFEKIPILPKIVEQLEDQLTQFVFSIMAPFIVPLIRQLRAELKTGSDEIIQSSKNEQHIVFEKDSWTDPTHSMLSKDHFSNILNEPAGQGGAKMLHWVVPQLMNAIDDDRANIDGILNDIIYGVLHHPAQRDQGTRGQREGRQRIFTAIKEWWGEMPDRQRETYRRALSTEGVEQGRNHKEGVHDTGHGHGCTGKLKMQKLYGQPETLEDKIAGKAADAIFSGASSAISGIIKSETGFDMPSGNSGRKDDRKDDSGGLGGLLGAAGSLLGGAFGGDEKEKQSSRKEYSDGSVTRTEREYGHSGDKYGQAEYRETKHPDGSRESQYSRYEQRDSGGRQTSGRGYEEQTETHRTSGGGYQTHTERREYSGQAQGYGSGGNSGGHGGSSGGYDSGRREESSSYGGQSGGYGGAGGGYNSGRREESSGYGGSSGGYGGGQREESSGYGGNSGGYGGGQREESRYGDSGRETSSYGASGGGYNDSRRAEPSYGSSGHGRQEADYGRSSGGASYGGGEERHGRSEHKKKKKNRSRSRGGRDSDSTDSSDDDKKKRHSGGRGGNTYGGGGGYSGGSSGDHRGSGGGYGGSSGGYGGSSGGYNASGGDTYGQSGGYGGSSGGYGEERHGSGRY